MSLVEAEEQLDDMECQLLNVKEDLQRQIPEFLIETNPSLILTASQQTSASHPRIGLTLTLTLTLTRIINPKGTDGRVMCSTLSYRTVP